MRVTGTVQRRADVGGIGSMDSSPSSADRPAGIVDERAERIVPFP
jgi:hypothetical protein